MDDVQHALIECLANDGVGGLLLQCLIGVQLELQVESLLRLELNVDTDKQLSVVFLIATVLNTVWNLRIKCNRVQQCLVRLQLSVHHFVHHRVRHEVVVIRTQSLFQGETQALF